MSDQYVIITAGGSGTRMGTSIPKQFLEINGLPVIMHCIQAFLNYSENINLILVLPSKDTDYWKELCRRHQFNINHKVCVGGETRFESVKNGLELVDGDGLVAVQDAVRPLASQQLINRCFEIASLHGNAVPAIPLKDSFREISGNESRPVDRSKFVLIQTPQVFDIVQIKTAYDQAYRTSFTDDATVAESAGVKINLVEGEPSNIKITTKEDLVLAEALLRF